MVADGSPTRAATRSAGNPRTAAPSASKPASRQNGERVFFTKYIDRDGRFRGLFVGHHADGEFAGRWVIGTGDHGRAGGHYREGLPGPATGGAFVGRWAETSCAADLPDAPAAP